MKQKATILLAILFACVIKGLGQDVKKLEMAKRKYINNGSELANSSIISGNLSGVITYKKTEGIPFYSSTSVIELYEVLDDKSGDPNGFSNTKMLVGNKINGLTVTKEKIDEGSTKFNIGNIPINRKFIIMLRYFTADGDGGTGNEQSTEITYYDKHFDVVGAFFQCKKIEKSKSSILMFTDDKKEISGYSIFVTHKVPTNTIH